MEVLERIQAWHKAQLERGRDPSLGVRIETLRERPGWSVQIDLAGTRLSGLKLAPYKEGVTDRDWLAYRIKDDRFEGIGDPTKLQALLVRRVVVERQAVRPGARICASGLIVTREQRRDGADERLLGVGKLRLADLARLHPGKLPHELAESIGGLLADDAPRGDERTCLAMHVVEAEDAVRIGVLGAKVTVEPRVEAAAEDVVHHPHRKDVGRGGGDAHFSDPDLRLRRAWLVDQGHHARRGLRPPGTNRRGVLAVLPRRESLLEQRQEGSRVGVADHEQGRVGRLEPRPVPGDEVLAGDGLHRAGRALARITPGMLLAEDHAREHVLSHRLRIVEGLRDLAEPLDPDAL